ncbi:hypothetical protein [uncultured Agrobacterium sp.]|uniref:hypothetical protein n=1 Tax=uncultured Agrobacterium sp. TaxID=157277 RepID=UPI0025CFFB9B|nr:hypothetical protein [uncultured Agrobacterium sp.]
MKIIRWTVPIVIGVIALSAFSGTRMNSMSERYQRGDFPLADISTFETNDIKITLERYNSHPLLAEYKRFVTVERHNGESLRTEIGSDPGGGERVDVCETSDGNILFEDRFMSHILSGAGEVREISSASAFRINPDGSLDQLIKPDATPLCVRKLGRFDFGKDGAYGFQRNEGRI